MEDYDLEDDLKLQEQILTDLNQKQNESKVRHLEHMRFCIQVNIMERKMD